MSFVRTDRLPPGGIPEKPFRFAPDLAVEVISPSERRAEIEEKLYDYAVGGTPLVWLIHPRKRTVRVISADAAVRVLREGDTLDGGRVLPDFSCPVAEIFAGSAR